MTTPAPNPRSTPPPGTHEAASRGCACAPEGAWWWTLTHEAKLDLFVTRNTAQPPPHKAGCALAKEQP